MVATARTATVDSEPAKLELLVTTTRLDQGAAGIEPKPKAEEDKSEKEELEKFEPMNSKEDDTRNSSEGLRIAQVSCN